MSDLIFYMHDGPSAFRFELSGTLAGREVGKLEQAWKTASSTLAGKILAIDLTFVTSLDEKGRDLLKRWQQMGARFIANSTVSRKLIESATGVPYTPAEGVGPTFEPRFAMATRAIVAFLIFAIPLLFPAHTFAAELKQESLDAWDQYLHAANIQLADRAKGTFLWIDESPERLQHVKNGEVVVSPVGHSPHSVPSGLIHHWIGVAFIPGARIEDVITLVRDYERYPEFYSSSVVEAKVLNRHETDDRFSITVLNKSMFMKRALESEYQSRFTEVEPYKWYSIAATTRVQELAGADRTPVAEMSGYVWRMSTLSRYQERDGGVYIETEVVALSRTIPGALHLVVDPIIRRVSKATLATSLTETRDATIQSVKSTSASVRGARVGRSAYR
jgi:hypothetical protein